jgi:3-oxoacyl-[acyl-carrier protein] reductase
MEKTVIVTGANGQLGQTLTDILLNSGYRVIGIDIHHEREQKHNYIPVILDITDEDKIRKFFEEINSDNEIFALINNAGVGVFSPYEDRTIQELKYVFDVNIIGTLMMTKHFMSFTENNLQSKRVVNLGSIYGEVAPDFSIYGDTPRRSSEIYGMTKAAIINFTKYLVSYYKDTNTTFNCVSPGGIESTQGNFFKEQYSKKVPLNRMAQASEVANIITFLLSEKASYVNGENIFVDGGFTKW